MPRKATVTNRSCTRCARRRAGTRVNESCRPRVLHQRGDVLHLEEEVLWLRLGRAAAAARGEWQTLAVGGNLSLYRRILQEIVQKSCKAQRRRARGVYPSGLARTPGGELMKITRKTLVYRSRRRRKTICACDCVSRLPAGYALAIGG